MFGNIYVKGNLPYNMPWSSVLIITTKQAYTFHVFLRHYLGENRFFAERTISLMFVRLHRVYTEHNNKIKI